MSNAGFFRVLKDIDLKEESVVVEMLGAISATHWMLSVGAE